MKLFGRIIGGDLPAYISQAIDTFCMAHEGRQITIEIKQGRVRSNKQNAYYWGVVVPCVMDLIKAQGDAVTDELAHEFLKSRFQREHITVFDPNGVARNMPQSTTRYSTTVFNEYLEAITAWAVEYGCMIPSPIDSGFNEAFLGDNNEKEI